MTLSLKVEVMAGSSIESACKELQALVERIGVPVEAEFNEVRLMKPPWGDADETEVIWDQCEPFIDVVFERGAE